MLYYIQGDIEWIDEDYIVVDNHGIGYKIYTSKESISQFKDQGLKVKIYTQMILRDDDVSIFGFSTKEELRMFDLLMTVNGIGARVALGILSSISLGKLIEIIISEDIGSLTKAQGVGKKTAQRIILELKEKVDHTMADILPSSLSPVQLMENDINESVGALVSLGYGKLEAINAVNAVKDSNKGIEGIIKEALKVLSK